FTGTTSPTSPTSRRAAFASMRARGLYVTEPPPVLLREQRADGAGPLRRRAHALRQDRDAAPAVAVMPVRCLAQRHLAAAVGSLAGLETPGRHSHRLWTHRIQAGSAETG